MVRFLLVVTTAVICSAQDATTDLNRQIAELRDLVLKLQTRIDDLEKRSPPQPTAKDAVVASTPPIQNAPTPSAPPTSALAGLLENTTFNFLFDGYYGFNFNSPIGRTNLLRAYDVSSNSFSLNQADVVIENAVDPEQGKHFGARLDLQFGQATATLQGSAVNEPRPDIYRNIFQAYGTFAPNKKLTLDFGKWSSSIGLEGNYTQDQINYSRSYLFDFLPFYHMGVRAAYKVNDALTLNYWIDNGTQQTEAFNNYKDQLFGFAAQPHKNLSWTVNYYLGQEHPDVIYFPYSNPPGLPTIQGESFEPIIPAPKGKTDIFDSYATWQPTDRLTFAFEADYEIERLQTTSQPVHVDGGAFYTHYQLTKRVALAGRTEYLSDRGGLYSGTTQALKETTLTTEYKVASGFAVKLEWRRDFSNQRYFLTDALGLLSKEQTTATVGVVWWFGKKTGPW
ncbi:MAG: outer membrane beta-barrel protein [Bryobacteraceae bacterium]